MQLIISLKLNDNIAAIKHVVLILTMLVQLYLYCYAGDQLENVTGRIAYSAYDSPWYDFDVKIMKDLPMVMLRGKLPHQTTAGKFLPMNLFSFKEILKATEMIRHCNGHEDAMDAFLLSSSSIISLVKLLLHRVYWRQKSILVESVIHDWTYVKNSRFRDIMLKYARIGRLGSSIFFCLGCASVVSFVSSVVLANINLPWTSEKHIYNETNEKKLMLAAYCTFGKYYTSFFTYCAVEVLQFVQILVNGISQCGNDGFFFDLTMHMCGQFAILRMNFNTLGCDEFSCCSKLDILLKRHYRLVYLSHYLERAFTLVILAQILMSVVVLCVEGFLLLLSLEINDVLTAAKHGVFIISLLVQLFLYCFAGQTLEFQSKKLAYAIYESPWYTFDVNVMKNLPLIILRAASPQQLTAGKFVAINFMTFKEILKASASYLSVLRVMIKTTSPGMKTNWNSGMDYGFSMIRTVMWIVGVWPLHQDDIICTFRWIIIFIEQSLAMICLLIELFINCGDTKDALEVFLVMEAHLHSWINIVFARIYMKKIAVNVTSAIDDWSTSSIEKQSYLIMTGYARIGRIITMSQLMIGFIAAVVYFPTIFFGNRQQVVIIGNNTEALWNFAIPSTCLFRGVSYSIYKALFLIQVLQAFILYTAECSSDCFFFVITMHLCGQLKLLRIRFIELFGKSSNERNHYRNILGSWIRRHYKLIILAKNIEDTFNLNVLLRLSITTIFIAVSGTRVIMSIKNHDYANVAKSMVFVQFYIVQSFLFTHAGETLRKQSESIVLAIYSTTWHKLPPSVVKDFIFIMMRTKIPLQLYYLNPMASERWKDDVAYAITPFKLVAWSIGIWPLQVRNAYSLIRYVFGIFSAVLLIVIPCFEIYLGCTDAETSIDCLMLIFCGILGVLKIIWFRIYAKNLANNYSSAMKDYLTIENTKERAIMRKHAFMGRTLCCLILGFAYFSSIMYGLIAILDEYKHVNITNEGNDALFLNITLHVCGQVKILRANFLNFDIRSPHIYNRFNVLIERHKYLIKLARQLAEMISFVLLIELFLISILLCIMVEKSSPFCNFRNIFFYFEVYLGCTDAETSVDCLMLICCAILGVLKAIWFRIYAKNLATNYRSVMDDYLTIENIKERAIMRKHAFMGRTLCCLVLGFGCFSSIMYGLNAILNGYKHVNITKDTMLEYPVPSKCFMKYLNVPVRMHKIFCIIDVIALILASIANQGNDALFLNATLHICGQMKILRANFLNFDIKDLHIYDRFNVLIERHKYLIKLARELAEMISFVLLIELFIISILLCIMGFQLILQLGFQFILALKDNDTAMAAKSIMVQSTFLSQLMLYSFVGDYLKSQMEEVGLCIYQNTWYDFPAKLTRNLIFVIMRSESPVTLRAGHFIVVNLSTYMSILKASITYLSVLRSTIVILPSMEFHMGCTNTEQNIDSLMLACCGLLGVFKIICFRIYAKNLTDNYSSARNDYLTIKNAEYRAIMRKHAFMGRILSCFMVCFAYISVVIYSLIPLLGEDLVDDQDIQINRTNEDIVLDYPMPSRCALEYLHVPRSMYEFICIFEFIVLILTSTCNHGNDSLFLNITLHLCGQVKILKADFVNFVVSRFQFILALKAHNVVVIGKSALVLCTSLTQLSIYSFVGDHLKSQMEEIGLFIYQSSWYDFPTKLARNLIFIIMRTRSPAKLLAGNFVVVNLYSYYVLMASERWKNDIAYAMTPFKLLTWPLGIWPLQVYNIYSLIRCVLVTCCMVLSHIIVILPSMEFHMGCTNTEQNIDGLMLACCGVLGVLKTICFRIYAKNLTNNYSSARNDYLTIKNTEYRAIMRKHAFIGRILSCFMVCFSYISFQFILALKTHNVVVMGKSVMVLCTFLTQLSIYSFVGDHLKSQMEEVGFFIYQSNWFDLPTKLARNLIFIIMRTRSPAKLLAGNFIVVNLATYMSILKTSISYLSVLRVMIET
ncbi:Putative odorant receptor 22c [Trachymyrmex cornetzi]|uniref:Putative odorant receptor 22c n=1 Tax=Trachymyrmex cornetzi TaxID=471704 RepID=A0A195E3L8_9HYME|nr:Putative odorant receptor 22c [Trachymyrmex cornetzi]